jgi:catechol 2,3-dioxygenase-like lactoylglutathione lyase family enzyme
MKLRLYQTTRVCSGEQADGQPAPMLAPRSKTMSESAVEFATARRIHMGLAVQDLQQSLAFYRALFDQEPTKVRPRYAKFEVAEPPVNLALNEVVGATGPNHPVAHFGIQVKTTAAVRQAAERLARAGLATEVEEQVTCCYAVQTKVWATDPDGNQWEVFVVLDNDARTHQASRGNCCAATPATGVTACCGTEADCCDAANPTP